MVTEQLQEEILFPWQIKGRLGLIVANEHQPYMSGFNAFSISFSGGSSGRECYFEINETGLQLWKEYLLLPDGYELVRAYYGLNAHHWLLIMESDHLSRAKYIDFSPMYGQATAIVGRTAEGKVRLLDWKIIE
jgi:hypothetical protein